jgi:hypothetical protein
MDSVVSINKEDDPRKLCFLVQKKSLAPKGETHCAGDGPFMFKKYGLVYVVSFDLEADSTPN